MKIPIDNAATEQNLAQFQFLLCRFIGVLKDANGEFDGIDYRAAANALNIAKAVMVADVADVSDIPGVIGIELDDDEYDEDD